GGVVQPLPHQPRREPRGARSRSRQACAVQLGRQRRPLTWPGAGGEAAASPSAPERCLQQARLPQAEQAPAAATAIFLAAAGPGKGGGAAEPGQGGGVLTAARELHDPLFLACARAGSAAGCSAAPREREGPVLRPAGGALSPGTAAPPGPAPPSPPSLESPGPHAAPSPPRGWPWGGEKAYFGAGLVQSRRLGAAPACCRRRHRPLSAGLAMAEAQQERAVPAEATSLLPHKPAAASPKTETGANSPLLIERLFPPL
ncbi:transcription initiation factor TFIID subunit 4-like, partial [Lacerta agilis]|uniref:transcription initiation factor TFIID subunit 4-like n=1 Tax=Lacerta agilis TaxID=80427 RepID=UPI00141A22DE